MTTTAYATRDDVFNLALSAKAFVVIGQAYADIDLATGIIRLKAHGLSADDIVTLEVTTGGTLPTDLSAYVAYSVDPISFDLLRLVDPDTGDPIESYADGGSGWRVVLDLMRRLDLNLVATAARIDEHLTAHEPPLATPYPMTVVAMNARLAARRMLTTLQFDNAAFRVTADELRDTSDQDEDQLQRWLTGKPVHPQPVDQTPEVADNGARSRSTRAPGAYSTGMLY